MPSSKGKPTDPKLREKVKEEVKNETNKDGGGKGQWSAWKAAKLSKEYEKQGGSYENVPGSKNEPKKGTPQSKPAGKKKQDGESESSKDEQVVEKSETSGGDDKEHPKPKANTGLRKWKPRANKRTSKKTSGACNKVGNPAGGMRKSSRLAGQKRDAEAGEENEAKKKVMK